MTLTIGQVLVSSTSAHKGIVAEIVPNPNGTYRVRFEDGKWTTVTP